MTAFTTARLPRSARRARRRRCRTRLLPRKRRAPRPFLPRPVPLRPPRARRARTSSARWTRARSGRHTPPRPPVRRVLPACATARPTAPLPPPRRTIQTNSKKNPDLALFSKVGIFSGYEKLILRKFSVPSKPPQQSRTRRREANRSRFSDCRRLSVRLRCFSPERSRCRNLRNPPRKRTKPR